MATSEHARKAADRIYEDRNDPRRQREGVWIGWAAEIIDRLAVSPAVEEAQATLAHMLAAERARADRYAEALKECLSWAEHHVVTGDERRVSLVKIKHAARAALAGEGAK
jgi:hypothetical protein